MSSLYRNNTPKQLQEYRKQWEEDWSRYYWNEFVLKYREKLYWTNISKSENIIWDIIRRNLDKKWNWNELSKRSSSL